MRVQRLRVTFNRGIELRYITHLDLMRFWERALRRAAVPMAYSEGFSPHPQLSMAAPLPVGVTSSAELMDVFLAEQMSPRDFIRVLNTQVPDGLAIQGVEEIAIGLPSIQSQMRAAEYAVDLPAETDEHATSIAVTELLAKETIPWQHMREKEVRSYDLRPLIQDLRIEPTQKSLRLRMRLQADNAATGRPEQVLAALGLPADLVIERVRLILATPDDPACEDVRRGGAEDIGAVAR